MKRCLTFSTVLLKEWKNLLWEIWNCPFLCLGATKASWRVPCSPVAMECGAVEEGVQQVIGDHFCVWHSLPILSKQVNQAPVEAGTSESPMFLGPPSKIMESLSRAKGRLPLTLCGCSPHLPNQFWIFCSPSCYCFLLMLLKRHLLFHGPPAHLQPAEFFSLALPPFWPAWSSICEVNATRAIKYHRNPAERGKANDSISSSSVLETLGRAQGRILGGGCLFSLEQAVFKEKKSHVVIFKIQPFPSLLSLWQASIQSLIFSLRHFSFWIYFT